MERRRKERVDIQVWVSNNSLEEIREWLGEEFIGKDIDFKFCYSSEDISENGIFLKTETPLEIGSLLDLDFKFPDLEDNVQVKGRVVRIKEKDGLQLGMGIEFIDLEEKYKKMIRDFVKEK